MNIFQEGKSGEKDTLKLETNAESSKKESNSETQGPESKSEAEKTGSAGKKDGENAPPAKVRSKL